MKNIILTACTAVVALAATITPSTALPLSNSNEGMDYAFKAEQLSWWHMGIYGGKTSRKIKHDDGREEIFETSLADFYIGANFWGWLNVYGIIGSRAAQFGEQEQGDREQEYGAAVQFNILDHEGMEPTMMIDAYRVTADIQYTTCSTEYYSQGVDWNEVNAALRFSVVNETTGNKYFSPESISLYAGPLFSSIDGDSFKEKNSTGLLAGGQIFMNDRVSLDLQGQFFEETSILGGINVQF
jgi:hypothetical protein